MNPWVVMALAAARFPSLLGAARASSRDGTISDFSTSSTARSSDDSAVTTMTRHAHACAYRYEPIPNGSAAAYWHDPCDRCHVFARSAADAAR